MLSARLFAKPIPKFDSFVDSLFQDIDEYINEHKDKWWRKTGVNRARTLRAFIADDLQGREELTDRQIMWRLYSYCKMTMGTGALDTSKELRNIILFRICRKAGVSEQQLERSLSVVYQQELDAAKYAATSQTAYYIDNDDVFKRSMLPLAKAALPTLPLQPHQEAAKSREMLFVVLNAIDDYVKDVMNSNFIMRWWKKDGLLRAEKMKNYIRNQLVGVQGLNDYQLFARVLEMTSMDIGAGKLGTSKDLRIKIMAGMCQCPALHLDEAHIREEISLASQPIIVPGSTFAHVPDAKMVEIETRKEYLNRALKSWSVVEEQHQAYQAYRPGN